MNNIDSKERTLRHFNETADDYTSSHDGKFVQPMYAALITELENIHKKKCGLHKLLYLKNLHGKTEEFSRYFYKNGNLM